MLRHCLLTQLPLLSSRFPALRKMRRGIAETHLISVFLTCAASLVIRYAPLCFVRFICE